MEKHCEYPGCNRLATIRCAMLGCPHRVCSIHGNGAIDEGPDLPPIEGICWGCDGKGWGDNIKLPYPWTYSTLTN